MSVLQTARLTLLLLLAGPAWAADPPDCRNTQAPQRCPLYRQGALSCSDLNGGARRVCEQRFVPDLICRGRGAGYCLALHKAQALCDGFSGSARRSCVRAHLPAGCGDTPRSLACSYDPLSD